jgi:hypothetical protein
MILDSRNHNVNINWKELFKHAEWVRTTANPGVGFDRAETNAKYLVVTMTMWEIENLSADDQQRLYSNAFDVSESSSGVPDGELEAELNRDKSHFALLQNATSNPAGITVDSRHHEQVAEARKRARHNVSLGGFLKLVEGEFGRFNSLVWANEPTKFQLSVADPLCWWRERGSIMFPLLALAARRVFGIMPTSVDAERLCSAGALTFSDLRGKLASSKAAMLIFLSFAFRNGVHMPAGWSLPKHGASNAAK